MVARHAVLRAANALVVPQIRKTTRLRSKPNSFRENAGQKQRMIAHVKPNEEARPVICLFERRQHFKKILERIALARQNAFGPLGAGKFCQHFRYVIGHTPVENVRATKNVSDQDVKIEAAGNLQAPPALEQRVKEGFVIENYIARFLVGQEFNQALRRAEFATEHREDELDILRRKLYAAVGLNHFHFK